MKHRESGIGITLAVLCLVTASQAQAPGWPIYKSSELGFSIQHPAEAVVSHKAGKAFSYIRIQKSSGEGQLRPGEFLIEIFVVPEQFWGAKKGWPDCNQLSNAKSVKIGKLTGYRGGGQEASEGEGIVDSLCVTKGKRMYKINALRPSNDAAVTDKILDSFHLQ